MKLIQKVIKMNGGCGLYFQKAIRELYNLHPGDRVKIIKVKK